MQRTLTDARLYITAQARGTEYCLSRLGDGWFVSSRRMALGRSNMGGGKHYATLAAVSASCRAFADLDALQGLVYGCAVVVA